MTVLVAKLVASYLLGSLMGALLVGRTRGVDIREQGSGNAGGTNALRTQGKAFAFWVMVIDVGKALVAVLLVSPATFAALGPETLDARSVAFACGAAAVAGHVWPVFFQFRGGKGAATLLGTLAALEAVALLPLFAVFLCSLVLTGYVGLSTVLATWAVALFALVAPGRGAADPLFAFGVTMAVFITWTHRGNLQRVRDGNENRFEKVMLFRRRAGG